MNNVLAVLVLLAISVALCDGQCYMVTAAPVKVGEAPPLRCNWNGDFINVLSHMTKNCETCYCNEGGALSCCVNGVHIVHVPEDCKIVKAEDGCGERAVTVDNENEDCTHDIAAVSRRNIQ